MLETCPGYDPLCAVRCFNLKVVCLKCTTDNDVMNAIDDLGVRDLLKVKFENRANGQSKGFCVMTLGSEGSVRTVIEKLGKRYFESIILFNN